MVLRAMIRKMLDWVQKQGSNGDNEKKPFQIILVVADYEASGRECISGRIKQSWLSQVCMYVCTWTMLSLISWLGGGMGGEANVFLSPKMFGYKNWERAPFCHRFPKKLVRLNYVSWLKAQNIYLYFWSRKEWPSAV